MSRAAIIILSSADRLRAVSWIQKAPWGTSVTFKARKRSTDQNAKLWACLSDVATQKEHAGRKYPAAAWKHLFMHALGQEIQFLPSLDGSTFIPLGGRSSEMTKMEMVALIEFILAWGSTNGVIWSDPAEKAAVA